MDQIEPRLGEQHRGHLHGMERTVGKVGRDQDAPIGMARPFLDHQHRHGRTPDQIIARRAQDEVADMIVAGRADDDHRAAPLLAQFGDGFGRATLDQHRFDRRGDALGQLGDDPFGAIGGAGDMGGIALVQRMGDQQRAAQVGRQFDGPVKGPVAAGGQIGGDEDGWRHEHLPVWSGGS